VVAAMLRESTRVYGVPMPERVPMDLTAYERRRLTGVCYICAFLAGDRTTRTRPCMRMTRMSPT
jgi:hypothetical protein